MPARPWEQRVRDRIGGGQPRKWALPPRAVFPAPARGSLVRVTAQERGSLGGSPGNDDGTHRPVDAVEVPLGRGAGQST